MQSNYYGDTTQTGKGPEIGSLSYYHLAYRAPTNYLVCGAWPGYLNVSSWENIKATGEGLFHFYGNNLDAYAYIGSLQIVSFSL